MSHPEKERQREEKREGEGREVGGGQDKDGRGRRGDGLVGWEERTGNVKEGLAWKGRERIERGVHERSCSV